MKFISKLFKWNFLWFTFIGVSHAQTFNYIHYTVDDGLAGSNVYVMFQDSKNFLWFATENGVNRFDGKTFDTYTTKNGLADNDVLRIFEDSQNRIWFLSIAGHLSYYKDGKIYNEKSDPYLSDGFTGAGFFNAFEDSKKRIWFCSYNAIVSVLTESEFHKIKIEHSYPDWGATVDEDIHGRIHLYSYDRKYLFNEKDKSITEDGTMPVENIASYMRAAHNDCYFYSKRRIHKISKGIISKCTENTELLESPLIAVDGDSMQHLYVSSQQGAYFLENIPGEKMKVHKYLPSEWVNSVKCDNEGNLWFMTRRNGIYLLPEQNRKNKLFNAPALSNDIVYSLISDDEEKIWVGTINGNIYYLKGDSIQSLNIPDTIKNRGNILNFEKDKKGNIWVCSDGNIYKINSKAASENMILGYAKLRTLSVTFNTANEAVMANPLFIANLNQENYKLKFNIDTKASYYRRLNCVFYDNTDKLYISNIDGLSMKVGDSVINLSAKDTMLRPKVLYISQTKDSTLLLATDGYGLIFYKNGKVTRHFTTKDGLISDICRKVKVFGDNVFVCTLRGLTKFNFKNDSVSDIESYNRSNGLPSNDVHDVEVNGENIYVGTAKGVLVLNSTENHSVAIPIVYIRSVLNNSQMLDFREVFHLPSDNNDLTINFNAITFNNQSDVVYEYSLGKHASDWKTVSATELNFPNLQNGEYKFSVRARKNSKVWSVPQSFTFIVDPPFYKTWWFQSFAVLFFFGGLTLILIYLNRRRLRAQFLVLEKRNALNMERNRISADMHDDLGSDLSRVSVITELMKLKFKPENEIQAQLNKISEFVSDSRKKLDDIIWALNPSNDSIGSLVAYINEYCLNYFEGTGTQVDIRFKILFPDLLLNSRQRRIIFLVMKEIANNTLKHANAHNFHFFITSSENEILIETGDNGKGFEDSDRKPFSNGLKNIVKRIKELGGNVVVYSKPGDGTKYEITFPIKANML